MGIEEAEVGVDVVGLAIGRSSHVASLAFYQQCAPMRSVYPWNLRKHSWISGMADLFISIRYVRHNPRQPIWTETASRESVCDKGPATGCTLHLLRPILGLQPRHRHEILIVRFCVTRNWNELYNIFCIGVSSPYICCP